MAHAHQEQAVAVTRSDGGLSIHRFFVTGRGTLLPPGAVWVGTNHWRRFATDELIEASLAKVFAPGEVVSWRRIDQGEIPTREYRNAVVDVGGALTHDLAKAREIKRGEIREARAQAFSTLDAEWMKATGQKKDSEADDIEAKRQEWRDAPADPRIDAAKTVAELKAIQLPE